MNLMNSINNPHYVLLGVTLYHMLWQGALIGGVCAVALRLMRGRPPQYRYLTAYAALVMIMASGVGTYFALASQNGAKAQARAEVAYTPAEPLVLTARPVRTLPLRSEVVAYTAAPIRATLKQADASIVRILDRYLFLGAPWIAFAWSVGALILALRLVANIVLLHSLRHYGCRTAPEQIRRRFDALKERMGIRRKVILRESARVAVPCVIGVLRPLILLPASVCCGLSPIQLEAILAHELAHVRRHDYLLNLLQSVLFTLLFFHPVVWWLNHRIIVEREHCCDDLVAANGDARVYAGALAAVADLALRGPGLAVAATDGMLIHRIRRLLALPANDSRPARGMAGAIVIAVIAALCYFASPGGTRTALAQQTNTADTPPPERTLNFPTGQHLGTLGIRPWGAEHDAPWEPLGQATGSVTVPAGHEVILNVEESATADLSALSQLPPDALQGLALRNTTVTDEQMSNIQHMNSLRYVDLRKTNVGDETLGYLQNSPDLAYLDVWRSAVTDEGVALLENMTSMRHLGLNQTNISDEALSHLQGMTEMEYLDLWRTNITDEGVAYLSGMHQMEMLGIEDTGITDAALQYLSEMNELNELVLERNAITDAGLAYLVGLDKLQTLLLDDTFVTDAGVEYLSRLGALSHLTLPLTLSPEARERLAALGIPLQDGAPGPERKRTINVVDGANGRPVPGASIELQTRSADYRLVPGDASGVCTVYMPYDVNNPIGVLVDAEGYATAQTAWDVEADLETTIALIRSVAIGGSVVSSSGTPIAGAEVILPIAGERQWGFRSTQLQAATVQTDNEGKWALDGAPEDVGGFQITLRHPDYSTTVYAENEISMASLKAQSAQLVMREQVSLSGRVVDNTGGAIDGASVRVVNRDSVSMVPSANVTRAAAAPKPSNARGKSSIGNFGRGASGNTGVPGELLAVDGPVATLATAVTDAQGRFALEKCSDGPLRLVTSAPGYSSLTTDLEVVGSRDDLKIELKKSTSLRVQVLDADGKPVEGAYVHFEASAESGVPQDNGYYAPTNNEGRIQWMQAPQGPVQIRIMKEGYLTLAETLKPSAKELTFTLRRDDSIRFSVLDAQTGKPVSNYKSWLSLFQGSQTPPSERYWASMEHPGSEPFTLQNGRVTLSSSNTSVIDIIITSPGYAPSSLIAIDLASEDAFPDLRLQPLPALDGQIKLKDGSPVEGATLIAIAPEWPVSRLGLPGLPFPNVEEQSTTTSEKGHFTTHALPGYTLFAHHEAGFASFPLTKDNASAPELELQPWSRVEVTLATPLTPSYHVQATTRGPGWSWVNVVGGSDTATSVGGIPGGDVLLALIARPSAGQVPSVEYTSLKTEPGATSKIAMNRGLTTVTASIPAGAVDPVQSGLMACLTPLPNDAGEVVGTFYLTLFTHAKALSFPHILPGRYELSLRTALDGGTAASDTSIYTHSEPVVVESSQVLVELGELLFSR
jgi:beta-lactamase regulating signal transducer with metallopeptidase domain